MLSSLFQPCVYPSIGGDRFAALIAREPMPHTRLALVGLPDDLGVRLNSGRAGASQGPASFRAALARFGTSFDARANATLPPIVCDLGDVAPAPGDGAGALAATHERVTSALLGVHRAGLIPVCIGGGHDLSFAAIRALALHCGARVGGASIDAHLDVRDTPGSGMPFRSLIDAGHVDPARFSVLGVGRFSNAEQHTRWLDSCGGRTVLDEQFHRQPVAHLLTAIHRVVAPNVGSPLRSESMFVSFDLDSIDAAHAPGVSALNPMGLTAAQASDLAYAAGACVHVRHFDLMELCPLHDDQGRTARLAGLLFLSFVAGFAARRPAP